MNKKGYTIMEAVIAMFLVVVMVGTVFSALMSSRRAIIASSEKEEVLYSLNSAYSLLKDCRSNPDCHLRDSECSYTFGPSNSGRAQEWKGCRELFTFEFRNSCLNPNEEASKFEFDMAEVDGPLYHFIDYSDGSPVCAEGIIPREFYTLDIDAQCTEEE